MDTSVEDHPHELVVHNLGSEGTQLAVFELQGNLRDMVVSGLRETYLATGNYVADAKAISPQGAMSLAVAGAASGAAALSAAFSSTLFMATADPATLMSIGRGVGSAVMGAGGILGQAPFIPVAASLPVVAPILAIQALNTAVMMQQFKQVDQKLDAVKTQLDKVLARAEATHAGQLLAASRIVDEVYSQYGSEGSFSNDMLVRLALAERDVRSLAVRFRQLTDAHTAAPIGDPAEVDQANYDAHSAMLASLTEMRISYLRVCVDMQENPKSIAASVDRLKESIGVFIKLWEELQKRQDDIDARIKEIDRDMSGLSRTEQVLPVGKRTSLEKERKNLSDAYRATVSSDRKIMEDFHSLIESARTTQQALEGQTSRPHGASPTMVYWKDETGDHAFVTDQKLISA